MNQQTVTVSGEFIRLDDLLKWTGVAQTGGHAKILVQSGQIRVNGEVCLQRGKKLRDGDTVQPIDSDEVFVVALESAV